MSKMNKPKYKIGDILYDHNAGTYEVVKAIKRVGHHYKYFVIEIVNSPTYHDGDETSWYEETIDNHDTVVGNMFDKR